MLEARNSSRIALYETALTPSTNNALETIQSRNIPRRMFMHSPESAIVRPFTQREPRGWIKNDLQNGRRSAETTALKIAYWPTRRAAARAC